MTRVPEPTVSFAGPWSMRHHRMEMFKAIYLRALSKIWLDAEEMRYKSPWISLRQSDLRRGDRRRDTLRALNDMMEAK